MSYLNGCNVLQLERDLLRSIVLMDVLQKRDGRGIVENQISY
jgi:hypothetical protein